MNKKIAVLLLFAFLGGICLTPTATYANGEHAPLLMNGVSIAAPIDSQDEIKPTSLTKADVLKELGLFKGTSEGYRLEKTATRAEGLTMILRLIGEEKEIQLTERFSLFKDVPKDYWAYNPVNYGVFKGYINGTSPTAFTPEREIIKEEFLKILLSAMGHQGITIENAYNKAVEFGLLPKNLEIFLEKEFLRDEMVNISYNALFSKNAEGRTLLENLIAKGAVDQTKAKELLGEFAVTPVKAGGFAWNLNKLMPKDQNYMLSPLSIKMALAMAAAGADGKTKDEILTVLGIEDLKDFEKFSKKIIEEYSENDQVALNIANSIWLNQDYYPGADFAKNYQQAIADYFKGESGQVNNNNGVEKINGWVNEKTKGKIPGIIDDTDFLAYIINAIYFKGEWALQFEKVATKLAEFTDRNGQKSKIDFMNATDYFDYYSDSNLQMIRLPYKDGKTSMYVALPETKELDLTAYIEKMQRTRVSLSLPKFKTELSIKLNDVLKELGIVEAFNPKKADFKSMFTGVEENIYISDVIHKTFIEVDENGTEAAAVTGIGFRVTSMPIFEEPVVFNANRPFIYFIYDDVNQEILFMGEQAFAN